MRINGGIPQKNNFLVEQIAAITGKNTMICRVTRKHSSVQPLLKKNCLAQIIWKE